MLVRVYASRSEASGCFVALNYKLLVVVSNSITGEVVSNKVSV